VAGVQGRKAFPFTPTDSVGRSEGIKGLSRHILAPKLPGAAVFHDPLDPFSTQRPGAIERKIYFNLSFMKERFIYCIC
jgi:hypothetical protein